MHLICVSPHRDNTTEIAQQVVFLSDREISLNHKSSISGTGFKRSGPNKYVETA